MTEGRSGHGSEVNHTPGGEPGPEQELADRLCAAFTSMYPPSFRPRQSLLLAEIIADRAAWPGHDWRTTPDETLRTAKRTDVLLDRLVKDARLLWEALPKSDNYYVLATLMEDRARDGSRDFEHLVELEQLLPKLTELHRLLPRTASKGGAPKKDLFAREMARVVFWYLLYCEQEEPTAGVSQEGSPTSRASVLVQVVLEVIGVKLQGHLASVLSAVRDEQVWRDPEYGRCIILPEAAPPS